MTIESSLSVMDVLVCYNIDIYEFYLKFRVYFYFELMSKSPCCNALHQLSNKKALEALKKPSVERPNGLLMPTVCCIYVF